MRVLSWIFLAGMAVSHATSASAIEGLGMKADVNDVPWARWQGRLSLGGVAPLWSAGLGRHETSGLKPAGISLMGDYYFARSINGHGRADGLRATSGVVIGLRSQPWLGQAGSIAAKGYGADGRLADPAALASTADADDGIATLAYVGIGYTGLSGRGGWSVSADLGLLGTRPGSTVQLGRGATASGTDELVREMRLAPVLQLGISYAF